MEELGLVAKTSARLIKSALAATARTQGDPMETQAIAQEPLPVGTAVNLLWASLAVGLGKMLMDFSHLGAAAPAAFANFVLVFTFALICFLIFKISAGRNWARITFLVIEGWLDGKTAECP